MSFAADLELYATFENMGGICTLDPGDDSDEDAVASVSYRESGGLYQDVTGELYVHLADSADPAGGNIIISGYETAFLVERDFIYFVDLTFSH